MSVNRYDFERGRSESGCTCRMTQQNTWGEYVEYGDYSTLEAELAAVKRERDEAREMVDKFRWLVEVQELRVHRIIHAGGWADKHAGPSVRIAWKRRENSNYELRDTHRAALAECGDGKP